MTSHQFINTVRKLHCLDYYAVNFLTRDEWERFRDNPPGFMMRCGDKTLAKIWAAVEADGKPASPFSDAEPAEIGLK